MKKTLIVFLFALIFFSLPTSIIGQNVDCSSCRDSTFRTSFYVERDIEEPQNGDFICYTIGTVNFECVTTVQLLVKFDGDILANGVSNTMINQLPFSDFSVFNGANEWFFLLFDNLVRPNSLPDSSALAEICFEVVGNPGEEIKFAIGGNDAFNAAIAYANDNPSISCTSNGPQNTPLTTEGIDQTIVHPSCNSGLEAIANSLCSTQQGRSTGTARIDFFCGTGPYTVTYDTEPPITVNGDSVIITNLAAGIHTFRVEDANGSVTSPDQFNTGTSDPLRVDLSTSDFEATRCATGNIFNGFARLDIVGGNPGPEGYGYDWGGVNYAEGFEAVISGQPSGIYTVTITDGTGCEITETIDLVRDTVRVSGSSSPSDCNGVNTGSLALQATGSSQGSGYRFRLEGIPSDGGPPFFNSSQSGTNTQSFFNLPAGNYFITAEDASLPVLSCPSDPIMLFIGNLQNYSITTSPNTGFACPGGEQSVIIDINRDQQGASINYQISHEDNGTKVLDESDILINETTLETTCLPLGTYQLEILDNDGCTFVESFVVDGCNLVVDSLALPPICRNFDDGAIILTPISGTDPISYTWSTGETSSDIQNLGPGLYEVTIVDADLCSLNYSFNFPVPEAFTISFNVDSINCPGGITDIEAIVTDIDIDEYIWEPDPVGIPFSTLPDAPAGTYSVTAIDIDGCEETATITIGDPIAPMISVDTSAIFGPDCQGNLGSFFLQVQPNNFYQGPFRFETSSGENNQGFSINPIGMLPGRQWVLVSTLENCVFDTFYVEVPEAPDLLLDTINSDFGNIECYGDLTDVFLSAEGVTNIFDVDYRWPAPYDQDLGFFKAGVAAGTYQVTLTSGLCISIATVEVTQPDSFGIAIDRNLSILPLCNDDLADLVLTSTGGVDPINYTWTDDSGNVVSTDSVANGLQPGMYNVSATDNNGCMSSDVIDITTVSPVEAFLGEVIQPKCFGELGRVFIDSVRGGGGGPYRYQVDGNPVVDITDTTDVQPGNRFALVADRNGCDVRIEFTIETPEELSMDLSLDPQQIDIGMSGEITADVSSPSPIDTIVWQADRVDSFRCLNIICDRIEITPVVDLTYTATATNMDGCSISADISVNVLRNEEIFVSNIFAPLMAQNELNSVFQIFAGPAVERLDFLRVYDRWGNLVHEENAIDVALNGQGSGRWDGTISTNDQRGEALQSGVYVWVVQVKFVGNPDPQIRKGNVTLIY